MRKSRWCKVTGGEEGETTVESVEGDVSLKTPSLIRSLESGRPDKFRRRTGGNKEGKDT
jgi:hypothetical protein